MKGVILAGFFAILAFVGLSGAQVYDISPIEDFVGISSGSSSATYDVTWSSGGAGVRNCLTHFFVVSDADYTAAIRDGYSGEYLWYVKLSSGTGIIQDYNFEKPLCGSANTIMVGEISDGNYHVSYRGYSH